MRSKMKVLVFSHGTLNCREVRLFRVKVIISGLALGILTFFGLFLANHLSNDLLGLGYERMSTLSSENAVLKQQLVELSNRLIVIQHTLESLSDRGNELRLSVDLPKVEDGTGSAPIGGAVQSAEISLVSQDVGNVLASSRKLIDRLEREVKLQASSYLEISERIKYNKGFFSHLPAIKPMEGYYEIHGYGMRIHPVLGVYRLHEGIDILNDVGTKVYATGDGVVGYAGRTEGGYGAVIELTHGYGYTSLYAHLSDILVRSGQAVKRGQVIAKSGRTGLVSGPHLHYEVRLSGRRQNPADYFFDDIDGTRYRSLLASAQ